MIVRRAGLDDDDDDDDDGGGGGDGDDGDDDYFKTTESQKRGYFQASITQANIEATAKQANRSFKNNQSIKSSFSMDTFGTDA